MVIAVFLSLTVIILGAFIVMPPKRIHVFELLFIWMAWVFISQNALSAIVLNFNLMGLPKAYSHFWALSMFDFIIAPIFAVWCVHFIMVYQHWFKSIMIIFLTTVVLTEFDYLMEQFNMIHFKHWNIWWSFILYLSLILCVVFSNACYRIILKKDDIGVDQS